MNFKKGLLILILLTSLTSSLFSQQENFKYYESYDGYLEVNKLEKEDVDSLKKISNESGVSFVILYEGIDQQSVDFLLSTCTNIKKLQLYDYDGYDLSAMKNLSELKDLSISGKWGTHNAKLDLSSLNGINSLETLNISKCRITDLSGLSSHTGLQKITFSNNEFQCNLEFLAHTKKVTSFTAGELKKFSSLKHLTNLEYLELNSPRHLNNEHFQFIKKLKNLKKIKLYVLSDLSSISGIEHCKKLEEIEFSGIGRLTDISPLSKLTKLKKITIKNTPITKLPQLKCTELENLNIISTLIVDVKSLSKLKNLKEVDLPNKDIDLSPLYEMTSLERVGLSSKVEESQFQKLIEKLENASVYKYTNHR